MTFSFNKAKWIAWWAFLGAVLLLVCLDLFVPEFFLNHGTMITSVTTLVYVYLTYEILRTSRDTKGTPYINPTFILSSKIDEPFLKTCPELRNTGRLKQIVKDSKGKGAKNYIFIKVQNIGDANSIDTKVELEYAKKNLGELSTQRKIFEFGTLNKGASIVEVVDFFDEPGAADYLQIKKCSTEYNTVNGKYVYDRARKTNHAQNVRSQNFDDLVTVTFNNSSDSLKK